MAAGTTLEGTGSRATTTTVFVSDPTAEAERVSQALRTAGYTVVDVPLSMLVARVAVQHPRIILIDADAEGALDVVGRMRELPDSDDIDVLFLARPGGAVASPEEALAREGSGLFVRPVDVPSLVKKVETLTGGVTDLPVVAHPSEPPPSIPGVPRRRSSSPPSLPPVSIRGTATATALAEPRTQTGMSRLPPATRGSRLPSEPATGSGAPGARPLTGLQAPLSPELQKLLSEAEARAEGGSESDPVVPSPEDEIEAVLPAELLALLDEPIEQDDDDEDVVVAPRSTASPGGVRERTYDGGDVRSTGANTTGAGSSAGVTPRGVTGERAPHADLSLTPAPGHTMGGTHSGSTGAGSSTTGASDPGEPAEVPPAPLALDDPQRGISVPPPTAWSPAVVVDDLLAPRSLREAPFPEVLGPSDSSRSVARAIATRMTASLCFAASDAERRVVLREGDLVTLASTSEDESLLAFLGERGDLPKETVRRLAAKFPPFGRHAGAALVARGYLRQDQMWTTLRAHAEWLLARTLQMSAGRLVVEPEPPGRLAGEPSVFGGLTGAAVYVEVKRRFVSAEEAVDRLGGLAGRVAQGSEARLLEECNLTAPELERLRRAPGGSLRSLLEGSTEGDLATVVLALVDLGVLEVLRGVEGADPEDDRASEAQVMALDAEAVRERVRARMQLVNDGDYFALLGVARGATGYEVRRAFLELRRAFEPTRVLTADVADLADDVRKIVGVLEEAYDILKDSARRERYRRAIEAVPEA